jgi:4'-phosphopantetheinyl transferase
LSKVCVRLPCADEQDLTPGRSVYEDAHESALSHSLVQTFIQPAEEALFVLMFKLTRGEAHVWRADLRQAPATVAALYNDLSTDERVRASSYRSCADRSAFIVRRGLLRVLLARYLDTSPRDICFSVGAAGKLQLAPSTCSPDVGFNLSYSGRIAVYVVSSEHEVGIDVEEIRAVESAERISEQYFSAREVEMLKRVPQQQYLSAFFNCWTRKEAYVKALGQGLSKPLNEFAVSLDPNDVARLLWDDALPLAADIWHLLHFCPAPGFIGAVCVPRSCRTTFFGPLLFP